MKKLILVFVLADLVILAASCESDRNAVLFPSNLPPGVVSIPVGGTRVVQPYGLEIVFDTVLEDSRCPQGAFCFWGGMARIKLFVASSASDQQPLLFHVDPTQPAPDSSRYLVTDAGRFRIDLHGLDPYPDINRPYHYESYRVELAIAPYEAADSVVGAVVPSRLPVLTLLGDEYAADSLRINGRNLEMKVTYGGGCHPHSYALFMDPILFDDPILLTDTIPVLAHLYLHHFGDFDPCRALITEHLKFDLQPMLDLHEQYYGHEAPIGLNVYFQPDSTWSLLGQVTYEPPEYASSIMPLAAGNFWVYADTTWQDGVPTARIDTITVTGQMTDPFGEWWMLSQPLLTLGDRLMIKGDSIYTFQHGEFSNYVEREYIPPVDIPVTYQMILQGDVLTERTVYRSDTVISLPSGNFDRTWAYSGYIYAPDTLVQYLVPGVGFVYQTHEFTSIQPSETIDVIHRQWLIEYQVE